MASNEHDSAETFNPDPISDVASLEDVIKYLRDQHERIAQAFQACLKQRIRFLHVEPRKVFEGLTVGADGTDWNPGGGKGVYTYYSGAWNKLG